MAICISCGATLRYSLMGGFCDSAVCSRRERQREQANAAARRQRTAAMLIRSLRDSDSSTHANTNGVQ